MEGVGRVLDAADAHRLLPPAILDERKPTQLLPPTSCVTRGRRSTHGRGRASSGVRARRSTCTWAPAARAARSVAASQASGTQTRPKAVPTLSSCPRPAASPPANRARTHKASRRLGGWACARRRACSSLTSKTRSHSAPWSPSPSPSPNLPYT